VETPDNVGSAARAAGLRDTANTGLEVMLVYPIRSTDMDRWADHLAKVRHESAAVLLQEAIPLQRDESARLYAFKAR
jgi:hypothetical protein